MIAGAVHDHLDVDLREPGDAGGLLGGKLLGEAQPHHLELALREHAAGAGPELFGAILLFELAGG